MLDDRGMISQFKKYSGQTEDQQRALAIKIRDGLAEIKSKMREAGDAKDKFIAANEEVNAANKAMIKLMTRLEASKQPIDPGNKDHQRIIQNYKQAYLKEHAAINDLLAQFNGTALTFPEQDNDQSVIQGNNNLRKSGDNFIEMEPKRTI